MNSEPSSKFPVDSDAQPVAASGLGISNQERYVTSRHTYEPQPSYIEKPRPRTHVEAIPAPKPNLTRSTSTDPKPTLTRRGSAAPYRSADESGYLEAPRLPRRLSDRPLSPDALSNLSLDEFDQLRPPWSRTPSPFDLRHQHHRRGSNDGSAESEKPLPRRRAWVRGLWIRNLGLLYMVVAMLFGSLMNVTTRVLEIEGNGGKGLHPFQVLFARMSITVVLSMLYMWRTKTPHFPLGDPEVRWLLVARGMGGFFGVFGMYYSLLYLPMADATVITFLAPSLSCWACSFLINEPFTLTEKYGSLVAFIGVIFIARPTSLLPSSGSAEAPITAPAGSTTDAFPFPGNATGAGAGGVGIPDASNYDNVTPAQRLAAVGIALVGVFGSVCAFTTIRWIGRRAHPLISVNYFAVWCTLVSIVAQLTLPGVGFLLPADAREWALLLFLGACGFIMQFLLAAGLSYEKSSRATNMTYTSMLYALTFDKLIFGQTPGIWSIVGSTLILGSAVYMAVQREGGSDVENEERSRDGGHVGDEEEGVGLMNLMEDGAGGSASDSPSLEDVEMRRIDG